jgi:hypothetical protein
MAVSQTPPPAAPAHQKSFMVCPRSLFPIAVDSTITTCDSSCQNSAARAYITRNSGSTAILTIWNSAPL